jgi:hypothetical protein
VRDDVNVTGTLDRVVHGSSAQLLRELGPLGFTEQLQLLVAQHVYAKLASDSLIREWRIVCVAKCEREQALRSHRRRVLRGIRWSIERQRRYGFVAQASGRKDDAGDEE